MSEGPLRVLDRLPEGILEAPAGEMEALLGGPTLLLLEGERPAPLLVSTLLHGNEITGLEALQRVLREHFRDGAPRLPRTLAWFIGNVRAARSGVRRLPEQRDFNRVWPGTSAPDSAETRMAAEVVARMRSLGCFASIDIHNNTGVNPHYACVNVLAGPYLQLAALFSRTVVYFTRPRGVQSMAMARVAPAVTVECGQSGSPGAAEHAADFIRSALHLSRLPEAIPRDISVFHTVGAMRVPPEVSFGFGESDADLRFPEHLERMNFQELPSGTCLAHVRAGSSGYLSVEDNAGREAAAEFFYRDGDALRLRLPAMPAMLTCDRTAIRQDVLGYLMERYAL